MRCDRPACPDCLRPASVGYQCVDCVAQGQRGTRHPVTIAGARLSTTPIAVPVLVGLNVLVYLVTAVQAGSGTRNFQSKLFETFALWPLPVAAGDWWLLITSGFLHIGLVHLALNMIALWVIGRDLELVLGRLRFTAVYLLSLLGGSTAVFLFGAENAPVAGASGAVYGLMGGIAVAAFRLKVSLRPVLLVIGLNVVFSVTFPGISLLGHLGGLATGALCTAALVYAPRERQHVWQAGALAGVLVLILLMVITRDAQLGDIACWDSPRGEECGLPG